MKKIVFIVSSMSRKAGGLFGAVRSLARHVNGHGCNVRVFAGEDEFSSQDRSAWDTIQLSIFPKKGPRFFGYQAGLSEILKKSMLDVVHVHGLWMYPSVAVSAWGKTGKPYVVSPHGMLDPWAISNSAWKKKIAGLLYENAHLRGARCIHALCASEYESIRSYGLKNPVAIIPNGIDTTDVIVTQDSTPEWFSSLPSGCKILLFLGRIHPKKGLSLLLRAWAEYKKQKKLTDNSWHLIIAGWQEDGHQDELEILAHKLNILETVHFVGPQFNHDKTKSFAIADALILPSMSEGLPMVILEAWAAHLPVLMTPQCNIPEGFETGAAVKIAPTVESIVDGLREITLFNTDELVNMGQRGRQLVQESFTWSGGAEKICSVYHWICSGGPPPSCVRID